MKWITLKYAPGTMRVKTKFAWIPVALTYPSYVRVWFEKYYVVEEYVSVGGLLGDLMDFEDVSGYRFLDKSEAEEYITNMEKQNG